MIHQFLEDMWVVVWHSVSVLVLLYLLFILIKQHYSIIIIIIIIILPINEHILPCTLLINYWLYQYIPFQYKFFKLMIILCRLSSVSQFGLPDLFGEEIYFSLKGHFEYFIKNYFHINLLDNNFQCICQNHKRIDQRLGSSYRS